MKKKEIKLLIFIGVLLCSFLLFLIFLFKPYNYETKYNINGYNIVESYNKETDYYTFLISKDKIIYPYQIKSDFIHSRSLINEIKVEEYNDNECILPIGDKINFSPLCSGNEIYTPNEDISKLSFKYPNIKSLNKEYHDIKINYLNNRTYLIFNYKGFNLISDKENKEIKLFSKDVYNINLYYELSEYLILPDYNSDYYFKKLYVINKENGKFEEIEVENPISFESVFLGDYKNKIYLLDKKEEKEYEINLKKKEITEVSFQVLEGKKFVKKRFRDIINNNLTFYSYANTIEYKLENHTLYKLIDNYKIQISQKEVTKIIKNDDDIIYYLVDENLYMYSDQMGEVLLLSNSEWNFNNTNMIFINK